jgi:hypothetical protein
MLEALIPPKEVVVNNETKLNTMNIIIGTVMNFLFDKPLNELIIGKILTKAKTKNNMIIPTGIELSVKTDLIKFIIFGAKEKQKTTGTIIGKVSCFTVPNT